jgi:hypothetical protein
MSEEAPSSSRLGTIGLSVWQYGRNAALSAAEYMTPVLVESQFVEKGVLTPEEFVAAGDMLVLRCPTWQWQGGDPKNARPFLPPDKQFLLTRNVPCQRRACTLGAGADDEENVSGGDDGEEEWVATHASMTSKVVANDDVPDMDAPTKPVAAATVDVSDATAGVGALSVGGSSGGGGSAAEASLEEAGAIEADDPSALDADDFELAGDDAIVRAPVAAPLLLLRLMPTPTLSVGRSVSLARSLSRLLSLGSSRAFSAKSLARRRRVIAGHALPTRSPPQRMFMYAALQPLAESVTVTRSPTWCDGVAGALAHVRRVDLVRQVLPVRARLAVRLLRESPATHPARSAAGTARRQLPALAAALAWRQACAGC